MTAGRDPLSASARPEQSSRPLAGHPVVITRDVATAQAGISRYLWPQDLRIADDPTADGWRFAARLHHHELAGGLALAYLTYGHAEVVATPHPAPPGRDPAILVHLPLVGQVDVWAGREHATAAGDTAVITHPGQVALTRWAPGAAQLVVAIPTRLVDECLRQLTATPTPTPRFHLAQHLDAWAGLVHAVADGVDTGMAAHPITARHLTHLLVAGLLSTAGHDQAHQVHATTDRLDPPVRVAMTWIHDHYADPVGTRDIARAAGMTPRTLQRRFSAQVGMGPVEYLRRVRLVHARDELLAATPTRTTTVTDLAHGSGYLSRTWFSALYRRTYGEYPAETLRRHP
jgi:AraC-like DNA-binding protein